MKDYTGVKWNSDLQKWVSVVRHKKVTYNCGSHIEQKYAVIARDRKIIEKGLNVKLQYLKPIKR